MNKGGGYIRKNTRCLFIAIIILALYPLADLLFGDTTEPGSSSSYTFISIDIPTPSGQLGFRIFEDINDKGEIVAFSFASPPAPGFLLDNKFELIDIECPGGTLTNPSSINNHGDIAGSCFTGDPLRGRGFFRSKRGKFTFLDFPGANLTAATGINDHGHVVGNYRDSSGTFHGFFWADGLFLTIDVPFPGATSTEPNAINNVGQIVGAYDDNSGTHGFLYENGIFTSIDFPTANRSTLLNDINDDGQIVGIGISVNGDVILVQGFLLEDDRFIPINVPFSAGLVNDLRGINNRGQIVGEYENGNLERHGFIATPKSDPNRKKPHQRFKFKSWRQDGKETGS
jgi:probable HAF family extracellular repeat protein